MPEEIPDATSEKIWEEISFKIPSGMSEKTYGVI